MAISELLDELSARGVDLWVEGDRLKFRARAGALTPELKEAVSSQKAAIIEHLGAEGCTVRRAPLSHNQQGLYFLHRTAPGDASYNIGFALRIRSAVNRAALEAALQALVDRHESLRTTYETGGDGETCQVIWGRQAVAFDIVDGPAMDETRLRAEVVTAHHRPFDLKRGPVLRTRLFTRSEADHVLLFSFHHIAGDGQSVWTMLNELRLTYQALAAGGRADLPLPASTYLDFVTHQQTLLASDRGRELQEFWKTQLDHRPDSLALPWRLDAPGEVARGGAVSFVLPEHISDGLRALARSQATTLFTVLMAAWQILLLRYGGQDEVLVGTPVLGRAAARFQDVVGNFVNTVVVRGRLDSQATFNSFLASSRGEVLAGIEHQDYPFSLMVQGVAARWDPGRTPLFETMFQLQKAQHELSDLFTPTLAGQLVDFGGLAVEPYVFPQQEAMTDIAFEVIEQGPTLLAHLKYRLDRLDPGTVERMRGHFEVLLQGIILAPDAPVADLSLVNETERACLLEEWNATSVAYDAHDTVAARFESIVESGPARTAIVSQGRTLNYATLNFRANQIAHRLRKLGVGPDVLVGIALTRGPEMVASVLAVLKAGGGYVPLDPDFPKQRLAWMIEDSTPRLVITERAIAERLLADAGVDMLVLDDPASTIDSEPGNNQPSRGDGNALAYTIFTSGSTGRPKGIQIPRKAVTNFLIGMQARLEVTSLDRLLAVTTLSFDIAVLELMLPLTQGATVVIATRDEASDPARLSQLADAGISIMQATPATWRMLCEAGWKGHQGLTILCGGEALTPDLAARLLPCAAEVWNMYGPTETTVWSSMDRVTSANDITIGRPIANTSIYVLDRNRRLLPAGLPGELWISGDGVARGYLGLAAMTDERFVADPFRPGQRMYRTGDLARWRTDGRLEHLGRGDQQVKVRGFRIELQEVEQSLMRVPGVAAAVAAAYSVGSGDSRLVAYCTEVPGLSPEEQAALRASMRTVLKTTLPDYAVPSHIEFLDRLPMTPNGKIDRRALPAPQIEKPQTGKSTRVMSPLESSVARIWEDVLKVAPVGLEDNLFELGGHSLLAARLMRQLNDLFSVDLPLRTLFEAPTVVAITDAFVRAEQERRPVAAGDRIGTAEVNTGTEPAIVEEPDSPCTSRRSPLSHNQHGLYFLYRTAPGDASYNIGFALRIRSVVNSHALRGTLQALVDRHESLRTTYETTSEGEARQVIWGRQDVSFDTVDASALDDSSLRSAVVASHHRPFDLERGPVLRTTLYTRTPAEHVLLFSLHHIAGDGQSVWTMLNEIRLMYQALAAGRHADLPLPAGTYRDFVVHQGVVLASDRGRALHEFWKTQLDNRPDALALPWRLDAPGEVARGDAVSFLLPEDISEGLRALARSQGTTLFTVLMAAWQILLLRYGGQDEVLVGTPVLGRDAARFQDVVGNFVNTVVVRGRLDPQATFTSFLASSRREVLAGIDHQDYPFSLMVQGLGARWHPGHTPLFETMFQLQRAQQHELADLFTPTLVGVPVDFGGLAVEPYVFPQQEAMTDIAFEVLEQGPALFAHLKYRLDRLEPETVERMRGHLEVLLREIILAPDSPVADLPLVNDTERARLLEEWNATSVAYDPNDTVAARFESIVDSGPARTAIVSQGRTLNYATLNFRANQIAHRLRKLGVGPEVLVGISLTRGPDMVASVLAVLKAGGGYVPLDPDFPQQRLAWMIEDSLPRLVITERKIRDRRLFEPGVDLLVLDDPACGIENEPFTNQPPRGDGNALAYTIFTSGSTGRPKGIQIPRRAVTNFLTAMQDRLAVSSVDRLLAVTTLSFDIAVLELLLPLTQGATVVLATRDEAADPAKLSAMADGRISLMQATPTTWSMLCEAGWKGHQGLKILCGGEALTPDLAARLLPCAAEVWNMYGPTETTVWSSMDRVTSANDITIGRPIANTSIYVLDRNRRLLPAGLPGELWISGDGVARGYLGLAAMTDERFVADPFRPGQRMYRTGDLARWRTDGRLEHLGRGDQQVKVRGFRIELQEVEQSLMRVPGVAAAVAAAYSVGSGDSRLVAYCTEVPGLSPEEQAALRASMRTVLKTTLPDYAVPSHIEFLDRLPMTPNGKIDRRALPAPQIEKPQTGKSTRVMSPLEFNVARIWEDVLDVAPVGLEDNFFELGGHSLLAARLMRQLNDIFWVDLPLRTLFEAPTVAAMTDVVIRAVQERRPTAGNRSGTLEINTEGRRPPFFFFHAALEGEGFYCYNLARHLGTDQPFYAFEPLGLDGSELPATIEDMARVHVAAIRRIQPHGPYYLGAFCVSGGVALEAAHHLRAAGEEVAMLVVIESYLVRPDRLAAWVGRLARITGRALRMDSTTQVWLAVRLRWYGQRVQKVAARGTRALAVSAARAILDAGRSLLGRASRALSNEPATVTTPARVRNLYERVQNVYEHAIYAYVPEPYSGRLICISAERTEYDATPWQEVGTNVETLVVPGDHNTCITTKVGPLAETLRGLLHQAQQSAIASFKSEKPSAILPEGARG